MSDTILIFIPVDPQYTPEVSAAEQAVRLVKEHLPQADEVMFQITEDVEFLATGENLERIVCLICHSEIDENWWINAMDKAYEKTRFADLTITLPCCGNVSSLNDLFYEWSTGFTRFQLKARNPGKDVEEASVHDLEEILGCPLRKIWAHF